MKLFICGRVRSSGASHLNEYGTKITDALFDKNPDAAKGAVGADETGRLRISAYPLHKAKIKMINLLGGIQKVRRNLCQ